jgi:hypothetical protein
MRYLSALFVSLVLTACASASAPELDPALVYIDVGRDVGTASGLILLDGEGKGYVGPGCRLIFAVNAGVHTIAFVWDDGSVERSVEAIPGKTLIVGIRRGPRITLPDVSNDSDACSV